MQKLILTKNLRRNIMQGNPWLYNTALKLEGNVNSVKLLPLYDKKQQLAWVIYNPNSSLAARVLSLKKKKPDSEFIISKIDNAIQLRKFDTTITNAYRLINGEGDLLPGLVVDIYASTAVIQCDGDGLEDYWAQFDIHNYLIEKSLATAVFLKTRSNRELKHLAGDSNSTQIEICEHGAKYIVDLEKGQKTGFFLDQRDNRFYLRNCQLQGKVCNLFSYTGGFSINAGLGGANHVTSVDISQSAIDNCEQNWQLNGLSADLHCGVSEDVFDFLVNTTEKFDVVIVDPPSMAHSKKTKEAAIKKYTQCFAKAATKVKAGGHLMLSSCSSHISFTDFFDIITISLSQARLRGQVLHVSGQGNDHPFPHALPEMRYLKFVHIKLP